LDVAIEQIEKSLHMLLSQSSTASLKTIDAFKSAPVPDRQGKPVPLSSVVRVNDAAGPLIIDRLDQVLIAEITANPAQGVSLAEARALCEEAARTTLPKEYRLTWLSPLPATPAEKRP
jgi:multidrug efflux pump subunit AcrB